MSGSASISERIKDHEFINWIRGVLGFLAVKEAIGPTIDRELQDFQRRLLSLNRNECKEGQKCKFRCSKGTADQEAAGLCDGCHDWVCDQVKEEKAGSKKIHWSNSDLTKWDQRGEHWQLAKLFMGHGRKDNKTAAATDCSGLLQVLKECKIFDKGPLKEYAEKLLCIRNKVYHNPDCKVDNDTLTEDLESMKALLLHEVFSTETEAKHEVEHAISEIDKLKEMKISLDAINGALDDVIIYRELEEVKQYSQTNRQEIEKNRQEIEALKQLHADTKKLIELMEQRQDKQEKQMEDIKVQTEDTKVRTEDLEVWKEGMEVWKANVEKDAQASTSASSDSSRKRQAERKEKAKTQKQCLSDVSLDDLMKGEEDGVAQVRVLKFRFDRSKYGKNLRYIHLDVGDPSGFALIVAFGEKATELKQILEQPKKPRNLKIKGSIKRIKAQAGYEHYALDGSLVLAEDTEVTIITSDVDCPDPENIELVQVKQLTAYRSRVALKQALVTEAKLFKNHDGQGLLKMALYDGSEGRCTLLVVEVSAESALQKEVASTPIAIQVKEAWIYPFGDGKMLRTKEKDVVVEKNETLTKQWETEKTNVTQDVFEIPCIPVKCVEDIWKSCSDIKNGQFRHFRINASVQHVIGNDTDTEIKKEKFMYPGCLDDTCRKEVMKRGAVFHCPKCKKESGSPQWRYRLKIKLGNCKEERQLVIKISTKLDELETEYDLVSEVGDVAPKEEGRSEIHPYKELTVTAFDGTADRLMNEKSATDVDKLLVEGGMKEVKDIFEYLLDSEWQLKIKVKKDERSEYGPMIMTVEEVVEEVKVKELNK